MRVRVLFALDILNWIFFFSDIINPKIFTKIRLNEIDFYMKDKDYGKETKKSCFENGSILYWRNKINTLQYFRG